MWPNTREHTLPSSGNTGHGPSQSGARPGTGNTAVTIIMLLSGRRLSGEYPKVSSLMNMPGIQFRIIIPINFELVMFGTLILFELVNY